MEDFGNLDFADNDFGKPCIIDGIIGASIFPSILGNTHISGESGSPTALEMVFGYVIMGQVPDIAVNGTACIFLSRYEETAIENIVSKFWEIENVPKRQLLQPEELECEKFFSSSVTRDASGKFVVALPFRCSPKTLGESKFLAQCRLFSLERRLNKDQNLRIEYNKAMQDFLDQGHMRILHENEGNGSSYYVAHHPVIKIGSSTPVRVVLGASSPRDNGISLNDILYCGPKLQTDIVALLLNFRLFKVAVTADIRQMFRQIKVFELTVVAFGIKCSPYLALRTVKELVNREGRNYPLASQYILRDLYMADLVFSQDGEDEAYQVYSESIELFRRGNFDLTKWSTNSVRLLGNIPMEKRLSNMVVFKTEMKILGLQWDPQMNILSFKSKVPDEVCTKRSILSAVAQCYDPIGLLAPFILYLKLLVKNFGSYKELALDGIEWHFNSPLPPHMGGLWESNVKAAKNHIHRVLGNQLLTYEETSSLLTQVEALLNSRPLCVLSSDTNAPEALTPAHFLTLTPLRSTTAENLTEIKIGRLDRFQLIDRMVRDFWKRWRVEYLTTLQERQKWNKDCANITKGTVVLIKNDFSPPLHWPLGVITELHPGKDGIVRNVTVKTRSGTFTHPVVKLCPLPTQ
nr:unnamed protein product [Callosobruchus analis]